MRVFGNFDVLGSLAMRSEIKRRESTATERVEFYSVLETFDLRGTATQGVVRGSLIDLLAEYK